MAVPHVGRGGQRAFGPGAELGHHRLVIAAAQCGAVGRHIGAGDAFHGDDQHIARCARSGQQRGTGKVELSQPGDIRRRIHLVASQPVLHRHLSLAGHAGQQAVRQVVLLPDVGIAGRLVLQPGIGAEQRRRQCIAEATERALLTAPEQRASQQSCTQRGDQPRVIEPATLGRVTNELRIGEEVRITGVRHAPHGADQFGIADHQQRPEQHQRQCDQSMALVQQQNQQAAEGQVRQIAKAGAPAQGVAAGHRDQQEEDGEQHQVAAGLPPARDVAHRDSAIRRTSRGSERIPSIGWEVSGMSSF
ncbi:MAG: hypothetical protein GAK45_01283 [Pseudomonas citronellolis]|nr:MAG: hypothetical protein GAK45_01283 [Pseudomonas citronellolis]